jgi:8-amino-7-oxononanoate synthase
MSLADDARERLAQLTRDGLLRAPLTVGSAQGPIVTIDGRALLCLCSNNYLGFADDPAVVAAMQRSLERDGAGAGASRLISGTMSVHREAEQALASMVRLPCALLFSSGYAANVGALQALFGPGDYIFSDALNHASLIDGCRLSRASVSVYPHGDLAALEQLLRARPASARAVIVTESVFSMDGDLADLVALRTLADANDAALFVDEAHALGVFGPGGAGLSAALGVVPDVLVGTLGKAFGTAGAFVAGGASVIQLIENRARSYVFSTAPAPSLAAAAITAVALVQRADERRATLLRHAQRLRTALRALDYTVLEGESPIVPVLLGEPARAVALAGALREHGCFVQAIRPPTVPRGTSRLRVVPMATHSEAQIERAIEAFVAVRSALREHA